MTDIGVDTSRGTPAESNELQPGERPVHPAFVNDQAARWMGVEVVKAEFGDVVIEMRLREEMLNGFGMAQGGMVFAFADVAFALACNDPDGDGSTITVATGVDVNFLNPGFAGRLLTATARLVNRTGRSGLYDITVSQENPDGGADVLLEFRGRSRTVPNPARNQRKP
jgi:acyl-CoA thioesterase